MAVSLSTDGALRTNCASASGVFAATPAMKARSANLWRDGPKRPAGPRTPGIVWQTAHPTRSAMSLPALASPIISSLRSRASMGEQFPVRLPSTTRRHAADLIFHACWHDWRLVSKALAQRTLPFINAGTRQSLQVMRWGDRGRPGHLALVIRGWRRRERRRSPMLPRDHRARHPFILRPGHNRARLRESARR